MDLYTATHDWKAAVSRFIQVELSTHHFGSSAICKASHNPIRIGDFKKPWAKKNHLLTGMILCVSHDYDLTKATIWKLI